MLFLHTLGTLQLEGHGLSPGAVQRLRLAILAAIAAEPGINRDRLVALFWPDSEDDRARGALKQAIYALRRQLDCPEVLLGVDHLSLNPSVMRSDVGEFEAALKAGEPAQAVTTYQGPFLSGVHLGNGEFDQWRDRTESRLSLRYRQALQQLARDADGSGDQAAAIGWWRRLAVADPLSGTAALSLVRSMAEAGDRTGALQHAAAHTLRVRAELEVEPDPELTAFAARLRLESQKAAASAAPAQSPGGPRPEKPPPVEPSSRVRKLGIALTAGALFLVLAAGIRVLPVSPGTVLLRVQSGTRGLDSTVEAAITNELFRRNPAGRLVDPWGRRAEFDLTVSARRDGDSLVLRGTAWATSSPQRYTIGPLSGRLSDADTLSRLIAEQATIALEAGRNPLTRNWAHYAALPSRWDALQLLVGAIASWEIGNDSAPISALERASQLDPTSGTLLVWSAFMLAKDGQIEHARSVLARLDSVKPRLGEWDVRMVDVIKAWTAANWVAGHEASHRLLELVPRSEWVILAAYDGMNTGRGPEALELLEGLGGGPPWLVQWRHIVRMQAWYQVGQFDSIVVSAREILSHNPDDVLASRSLVKGLAGLGRVQEVEAVCDLALRRREDWGACAQAGFELRGRGFPAEGRRVADRYIAAVAAADTTTPAGLWVEKMAIAYDVGDWTEIGRLADQRTWDQLGEFRVYKVKERAWRGDTAAVRRGLDLLEGLGPVDPMDRAEIAALLGSKEHAVQWIEQAFRMGYRTGFTLLGYPGFDALMGYPPFERLIAPVRDTGHLAMVRQVASR